MFVIVISYKWLNSDNVNHNTYEYNTLRAAEQWIFLIDLIEINGHPKVQVPHKCNFFIVNINTYYIRQSSDENEKNKIWVDLLQL